MNATSPATEKEIEDFREFHDRAFLVALNGLLAADPESLSNDDEGLVQRAYNIAAKAVALHP